MMVQANERIKGRSLWSDGLRRFRKQKLAVASFWICMLYFALAGFIWITELAGWQNPLTAWDKPVGPSYQAPLARYVWPPDGGQGDAKPTAALFGTDFLGRSTLLKTIYGAKTSITVALCASIISLLIGVPLGAIAGYVRGWFDDIVMWLITTLNTVPYILLVMAFAVVLKEKTLFGVPLRGVTGVYLAMGLTSWVGIARLIRGEILKRRESEYALAAQAIGCSAGRIIFRHLLPNVFHIILINFSLRFVGFIHAEVILSFLGLGETDKPSWGAMIDAARAELARNVWWEMAAATVAIFILSLALNIVSDALRDCLDPKLRTD